ncbi:MAG: hypothetical protein SF187_05115 [Deltaproteobacteria bacterium]|nr:hypothetical protein [Deltaproteobacteria bacterium]
MLQPLLITETAQQLKRRVEQRFPGSGLGRVAAQIETESSQAAERIARLSRPTWSLRLVNVVLAAGIAAIGIYIATHASVQLRLNDMERFIQFLEPALGSMVFIGAGLLSIWSLEARWKRRRTLQALHNLRSLAHVIDMHQLTKDPERLLVGGPDTKSSPKRSMNGFELGRYLDYCSEMLSIIGKVAAMWAEKFTDPEVQRAVDQLENLTSGLSRKIWQKMMILTRTNP